MIVEKATIDYIMTNLPDSIISIFGADIIAEHLVRKYGSNRALSFYYRKMKKLADSGKKISDFQKEQMNEGWEILNPDIVEARWRDKFTELISTRVVVKTAIISKIDDTHDQLRKKDVFPIVSKLAQMAGAWICITEKISFDKLLKPSAKTIMAALKKDGWEGAQEVIKIMSHNLLGYFGYDCRKPQSIPTVVKAAHDHMMDSWIDALIVFG